MKLIKIQRHSPIVILVIYQITQNYFGLFVYREKISKEKTIYLCNMLINNQLMESVTFLRLKEEFIISLRPLVTPTSTSKGPDLALAQPSL